jgi:hypothetical protein
VRASPTKQNPNHSQPVNLRLLLLALFILVPLRADNGFEREALRDPYRTINGKYCDLRPLFQYYQFSRSPNSPMPYWRALRLEVLQWFPDGILAKPVWYGTIYESDPRGNIWLRNYPGPKLTDGTQIKVICANVGTFDYTDAFRVKHTIPAYDYGHIYSPAVLAAQTNSVPTATNTVAAATTNTISVPSTNPPVKRIFIK